ncbi:ABC transporter ATP-binding protein [Companilactobacillus ginsenosidimutans]|uniref:ABC transporter n=1 Tax=Companilactobacillus ginsenosidimutans TaxID=1007676 RepID=A0A0H4R2F8_9LACO|nr:ABC transporter ATP-binding protein [Companilactobacillus ginsenosidimutans]AKP67905.1 ABC transporter [Companilactobacillus ginsenosidimutans]
MDKLAIKNLTFRYKNDEPDIIKNLDFTLKTGTFNILYGASGCGKSTLMKIIAGLYPEYSGHLSSGEMFLDGKDTSDWDIQKVSRHVAILFQNPIDQFSMTTVKNEFIFTLENIGIPSSDIDNIIDSSLKRVGISGFKERKIDTLSGGELQKVSIAITLAMDADFIMLDEPFASIDMKSRGQLLSLLKDLQVNDGKTILITDHDLNGYQELIDNLYHFQDGTLEHITNQSNVFSRYQSNSCKLTFDLPIEKNEGNIINIQNLHLQNGSKTLLADTSFSIFKNKMILLTGENGTGKSTFFSALTRLHDFKGQINYQDKNILKYNQRKFARQIGFVFQDSQMQYLKLTVQEEIDLSLKYTDFKDFWTSKAVDNYLLKLKLDQLKDHVVYQLSGGQKKKLQIFEMLILGTPVLLLDEPLAGLDIDSALVVMTMIKEISERQNQTILLISHQLSGLNNFFDYHLELRNQTLEYSEVANFESIS